MATTINDDLLRFLLPKREFGAHKGGVGGVMLVAGSPQFPGSALLSARTAGRSGAGMVFLAAPRSVIGNMACAMPEVVFLGLPETESVSGARRAVELMDEKQHRVTGYVIGPGLGDDESTHNLLSMLFGFSTASGRQRAGFGFGADSLSEEDLPSLLTKSDATIVVDADGLNWLAKQDSWWETVPVHRMVLTPHPMEAQRLSGLDIDEILADPAATAEQLAQRWKQTVVIKAGFTAVSDGTTTIVSDLAPTSLATAGSGDCFAAAIGAYLSQGCSALDAATLAIGIGCRAAVVLEREFGAAGVIAGDLPDAMARVTHTLILESDTRGKS